MRIATAAAIAAAAMQSCGAAWATCSWEWLCNGEGVCKQMPVCDSVYEVPPPRPEMKPPEMPPLSMRPSRANTVGGMSRADLRCEHIMRQSRAGRWSWSEACFCVDRSKNPDPSDPFANIVRCDERHTPAAQAPEAPAR
jgi:hypothetical protein